MNIVGTFEVPIKVKSVSGIIKKIKAYTKTRSGKGCIRMNTRHNNSLNNLVNNHSASA